MAIPSNTRRALRRAGKAGCIAACLLSFLSAPRPSFGQDTQELFCPKGYSIFETVCLNEATGDVVNQSRANGPRAAPPSAPNPAKAPASAKSGG
jgi:hypothetical protein